MVVDVGVGKMSEKLSVRLKATVWGGDVGEVVGEVVGEDVGDRLVDRVREGRVGDRTFVCSDTGHRQRAPQAEKKLSDHLLYVMPSSKPCSSNMYPITLRKTTCADHALEGTPKLLSSCN